MFTVAGPSNFTDVTPQGTAPSTEKSELLGNVTVAGQRTEDATTSNRTDPDADDSKSIAFDIPTEQEISEPALKFDDTSEDVENEANGRCSLLRYIFLRW
jgi:hypothetical protein